MTKYKYTHPKISKGDAEHSEYAKLITHTSQKSRYSFSKAQDESVKKRPIVAVRAQR